MPDDLVTSNDEALDVSDDAKDVNDTAESSDADTDVEEKSVLDAVQSALADPEDSSASEKDGDTADSEDQADEDEELPELTEEEITAYPRNSQRRIRQLVSEKNETKTELETLGPKAQQFDQFVETMNSNGLTAEDVNSGFEIMALMKTNPVAALEKLAPMVQQLNEMTGQVLPADLVEEVNNGEISMERAQELAKARARGQLAEDRSKQLETATAEEKQAATLQAQVEMASKTATEWFNQKQASDPDWNLKQARVTELVELEVRRSGKYPETAEAVMKLADDALAKVEEEMKSLKPKPKKKDPAPDGNASSRSKPEPKSTMDAIELGLSM